MGHSASALEYQTRQSPLCDQGPMPELQNDEGAFELTWGAVQESLRLRFARKVTKTARFVAMAALWLECLATPIGAWPEPGSSHTCKYHTCKGRAKSTLCTLYSTSQVVTEDDGRLCVLNIFGWM
eukprot:362275-Chlamydomonas_euryale.AAC.3